jgi:hypothetical protein
MTLVPLRTPLQQHPGNTLSAWDIDALNACIEALPRGDVAAFGGAVRNTLLALNRSRLERLGRYDAMERLRPVVNDACAKLVDRYRASSLPLSDHEQADADLARQLYAELATGFKIAVNEEIDRHRDGDATPLQLAVQRTLLSLGRVLLECYRVYAPEPPLLWRDIHTLYRNSESVRLQALPVYGTLDSDETALSIKQAYLRIAVLAMANPYRLIQGEAEELYRRIGRWVHFVQLTPAAADDARGRFAIDLDSDLPARYVPRDAQNLRLSEPRVIELQTLVDALGEQIAATSDVLASTRAGTTLSLRMQRDMYVRFRSGLSARSERGDERKPTLARLMVVEGLMACHLYLDGRRPFTPEQDEAARLAQDGGGPPGAGRAAEAACRAWGCEASPEAGAVKPDLAASLEQEPHLGRRAVQWHRKNESDGGMALFCAENCRMRTRVGELVAYAEDAAADPGRWRIGSIRWLRTRPNGGIELGISRFADSGYAVGTRATSGSGKGSGDLPAILIPRLSPTADKATLLTPAGVYDIDSVLRLTMRDLVLHVKLTELVEATRLFARFRFKPIEDPGPRER